MPERHLICRVHLFICVIALGLTACEQRDRTNTPRADALPPAAVGSPPDAAERGLIFDPGALRPGMAVGDLITDSVDAQRTSHDSTYVGVARFRGQIDVSGWSIRHPEADMRDLASCFEADSASAARLPRWQGDARRPWFCFVNSADAVRPLGPPSDGVPATVVIESFTIHRGLSDEVNTARFLRRLTRCYRSAQSVLFGPRTTAGQQGQGPGWLRLDGSAAALSGYGELVDADRKGLGASWRRVPNDSMSVVALSDHLRVDLQLIVSDSVAVGSARAHSDATVEPDRAGRLGDLRRAWTLRAVRVSCDSMPERWR